MNEIVNDAAVFSAMQTGEPYKSYRKTILAKVYVRYLDSFRGVPTDTILWGPPGSETSYIDVWSEKEDVFLKRMNPNHIKGGVLIPFERKAAVPDVENPYNIMTDEELLGLLGSHFFTLDAALNKMTSVAPVSRLLYIAEVEEKSEKILNRIRGRLAELQEA